MEVNRVIKKKVDQHARTEGFGRDRLCARAQPDQDCRLDDEVNWTAGLHLVDHRR